ncbi:hypothetical protein J6590_024861 [Homalodisca vitripennis]|nr:hypothetical protein J6590_024861 [Homalodisca vitripennis]
MGAVDAWAHLYALSIYTLIIYLLQGCYRSGKSGKSGKSQGKKTGLEIREKSGNPVSSQGKVREFRRWSGKNIKSLYTNKLTAAGPSPSLQTTLRMKQAAEAAQLAHPLIAKNPGDCVEKSQGKMKNLVWKSGKSQGISLLDSCSNPVLVLQTLFSQELFRIIGYSND